MRPSDPPARRAKVWFDVDISPDLLRPVLFFGLLLGPTCIWLITRAYRGRSASRISNGLVEPGGEWVCTVCSSVNLAGARRCYKGCAPGADAAPRPVPVVEPAPLVAVGPGLPAAPGRPVTETLAVPVAAMAVAARPPAGDRAGVAGDGCPHLGLRRDPRSRFEFADAEHRCYVTASPRAMDLAHQHAYCLGRYAECVRYRAREDVSPSVAG